MDEQAINEILTQAQVLFLKNFRERRGKFGGRAVTGGVEKIMSKKKPDTADMVLQLNGDDPQVVRDAIALCGEIIDEAEDKSWYAAVVTAGFNDANFAIIIAAPTDDSVHLRGYAHEGLIKQHTVEKAFEKIETHFNALPRA